MPAGGFVVVTKSTAWICSFRFPVNVSMRSLESLEVCRNVTQLLTEIPPRRLGGWLHPLGAAGYPLGPVVAGASRRRILITMLDTTTGAKVVDR